MSQAEFKYITSNQMITIGELVLRFILISIFFCVFVCVCVWANKTEPFTLTDTDHQNLSVPLQNSSIFSL